MLLEARGEVLTVEEKRGIWLEVMSQPGIFLEREALELLPHIVGSDVQLYCVTDMDAELAGCHAALCPAESFIFEMFQGSIILEQFQGSIILEHELPMQLYFSINEKHFTERERERELTEFFFNIRTP